MAEVVWDTYPWVEPVNHACRVLWAQGWCVVRWPSGAQTLEGYAGTAVLTDLERLADPSGQVVARKQHNLECTMRDFRSRTDRGGWWIRERRGRKKPRRIVSAEWIRPSAYRGPAPAHHSVLP